MEAERIGKVQTVRGLIEPQQMGITLMHEHLVIDLRHRYSPPDEASRIVFGEAPVTPERLWDVQYDPFGNLDNVVLFDEQTAIDEVMQFKLAGGGTIVDTTTRGLGRDPLALRRISAATGLHVTMGAGYYVYMSHPPDMDERTEDQLFEEIVRDVDVGVGNTGIKAGEIGEIGCEMHTPNEMKVVRAAARAQRATGAMLNIHQQYLINGLDVHHIADAIEGSGGDLSRTVISHMDGREADVDYQVTLLERGLTLEYDVFGLEIYIAAADAQLPQDSERIKAITRLVNAGWAKQLVIAQDVCMKMMLTRYGGAGYAHILNRILPRFRKAGIGEDQITTMLVDNPRRLLPFVAPKQ
jgi:phosphotriesterase-related protein